MERPGTVPTIPEMLGRCEELLPSKVVEDLVKESKVKHYDRIYSPLVTIWCMIFQRLNPDHVQDAVVAFVVSGGFDHLGDPKRPPISVRIKSTKPVAYCKARKRLPLEVIQGVAKHFAQRTQKALGEVPLFHGRLVALLDGTMLIARPKPDLLKHYDQARNQKGPSYWVLIRTVAAFCLHSGAILGLAEGSQKVSEQALTKTVFKKLAPDIISVGDSNFGVYSVAQAARHQKIDVVLRLTESRARRLAKGVGALHSGKDRPIEWDATRSDQVDAEMDSSAIRGRLIYEQLHSDGFRPIDLYLFTTLTDACYLTSELVDLYKRRWEVELDLRCLKTVMDLALLTATTQTMLQKDLWAAVAAYNLVCLCMTRSAIAASILPAELSFAKCLRRVQMVVCFMCLSEPNERTERLLTRLAMCRKQKRRPFRVEPRAVRKRRLSYPPLKGSRGAARQRETQRLMAKAAKADPTPVVDSTPAVDAKC